MLYAAPDTTTTALLTDAPPDLVGTLTFQVRTIAGAVVVEETTAGITEAAGGDLVDYAKDFDTPSTQGTYLIVWTNGDEEISEELVVTFNLPVAPAPATGAYAALVDVRGRCPARSFTGSSRPTEDDVYRFLRDTALELDGILQGAGYQLPIPTTATMALGLLRSANAIGAWARVEHSAPVSDTRDQATKEWVRVMGQLDPKVKGPTLELAVPRQSIERYAGAAYVADVEASRFFTPDMEF